MFGIEYWKLAVSLGVPGVALAVFLFLLKQFQFDISTIPRVWRGPLAVLFIFVVGGITLFALERFGPSPDPRDYTIHVRAVDPEEMAVDDAAVSLSPTAVSKIVSGGWEFSLSKAQVPANGKVAVFAEHKKRGLHGEATIELKDEEIVSVTVHMEYKTPMPIEMKGTVRDKENRAIPGVRISCAGGETLTTNSGRFLLKVDAEPGKEVRLHVEADGYKPQDLYVPAGADEQVIMLEKKGP